MKPANFGLMTEVAFGGRLPLSGSNDGRCSICDAVDGGNQFNFGIFSATLASKLSIDDNNVKTVERR